MKMRYGWRTPARSLLLGILLVPAIGTGNEAPIIVPPPETGIQALPLSTGQSRGDESQACTMGLLIFAGLVAANAEVIFPVDLASGPILAGNEWLLWKTIVDEPAQFPLPRRPVVVELAFGGTLAPLASLNKTVMKGFGTSGLRPDDSRKGNGLWHIPCLSFGVWFCPDEHCQYGVVLEGEVTGAIYTVDSPGVLQGYSWTLADVGARLGFNCVVPAGRNRSVIFGLQAGPHRVYEELNARSLHEGDEEAHTDRYRWLDGIGYTSVFEVGLENRGSEMAALYSGLGFKYLYTPEMYNHGSLYRDENGAKHTLSYYGIYLVTKIRG